MKQPNKTNESRQASIAFVYDLDFSKIDFSLHPELYRIGKGEQGVLLVEPYKSQILPHWKFRTVADAKESSKKIYSMFLDYLKKEDFPGADMARSFYRWDGPVRVAMPIMPVVASTTRKQGKSCLEQWTK